MIILFHEFGHFITAKMCGIRVNEFALGMGPRIFKFKKGETTYSLRALPIGGFCAMEGENDKSKDPRAFSSKAVWKRMIVVSAGGIMNIILGIILMFIVVVQQPIYSSITIAQFQEGAMTQAAGLQVDDEFYAIDGYRTFTARDVTFALAMADANDMQLTVLRDGETVTFDHVKLKSDVHDGKIYAKVDFLVYPIERNIGNVFTRTFADTVSYTRMVWTSLAQLVTGQMGLDSLSGPVGTATAITQVASEGLAQGFITGLNNIILLMVIITINLGIVNLLPIPALDGGRLLFLIIEAIRRKPLNEKYERLIHAGGFIVLIGFMVLISIKDIFQLF